MTERHPPLRNPHLEHPIEGSPKRVGVGCAVEATAIETSGFIGSGEPEGN
jgi:hypothetical protein